MHSNPVFPSENTFQFQLGRIRQSLPIARLLHVTNDCVPLVPVSCRVAGDREPFGVPDFIHFHGFEDRVCKGYRLETPQGRHEVDLVRPSQIGSQLHLQTPENTSSYFV